VCIVLPNVDICLATHSTKGQAALSELDISLKAAKLLLEQNQMSYTNNPRSNPREKRETIVKRPPIRDLINSFFKANFTLQDDTIRIMQDTTRDLKVCRKNCDRAFKLVWNLYLIYQQRSPPQSFRREPFTGSYGELSSALDEVTLAFHQRPFSISPRGEDGIKYERFTTLNDSHTASSQHQELMRKLGEDWVKERMGRENFQDAAGKKISKLRWLGGLQMTLFELLWSGTIEQLKRHSINVSDDPSVSNDPEREDLKRNLKDLQRDLQEAIMRAKKQRFSIAFCGMVKAGKSLFLNALIGKPILPSDGESRPRICWQLSEFELLRTSFNRLAVSSQTYPWPDCS
jgi:hypothetical protein